MKKKLFPYLVLLLVLSPSLCFGQTPPDPTDWCANKAIDRTQWPTCSRVTLAQMGYFDSSGTWQYDSTYLSDMDKWGTYNANDYPELWKPRKTISFQSATNATVLQVTYRADGGKYTRLDFDLPKEVTEYPEVYRVCPATGSCSFIGNFLPPTGCCPTPDPAHYPNAPYCVSIGDLPPCAGNPNPDSANPCCRPWMQPAFTQKIVGPVIDFSKIRSIRWVEKGIPAERFSLTEEDRMGVPYNFNSTSPVPMNGNFNFWPSPTNFAHSQRVYAYFPMGTIPDANTPAAIELGIGDAGSTAVVYVTVNFAGGDTMSIPPFPLTVNPKKPKQSLTAREESGQLIIEWEAPLITTPYMQLVVYVGGEYPANPPGMPPTLTYATLMTPSQMTMAILPADSWTVLKARLGGTAFISTYYRKQYGHASGTWMYVRSVSDLLAFRY